ncbi:MAG: hypothetical protein EOO94_02540, partial [Pedobacter sp.]
MKAHYKFFFQKTIRLGIQLSLIFFALIPAPSCSTNHTREVSLIWEKQSAKAISVPSGMLDPEKQDSIGHHLFVHLKDEPVGILGAYHMTDDQIIFTPAFPFTAGKTYDVVYKQKLLTRFLVPLPDSAAAPVLLSLYPSTDTLPENVLKLYLNFSEPMREGESLKHISITNNNGDTLHNTFLDLQPELWNQERNILTVWFDPGRIKRDLIPNLKLGKPLKSGEAYKVQVSSLWKNTQGVALRENYNRMFVIANRDSVSPDPRKWKITSPAAGTKDPITIHFPESLDYFLLKEMITILDKQGNTVAGEIRILDYELGIHFYPGTKWIPGGYRVRVGAQ